MVSKWIKAGKAGWGAIKGTKPQVKKTGTKNVIEHFKKAVTGLEPQQKASIYKTHVAPYVKKWSGKKGDKPSGKK